MRHILPVLFLLALAAPFPAAVIYSDYGPQGLALPFDTTDRPGVYAFQLLANPWNDSQGPEFDFVFASGSLSVGRNYAHNKNSKVVGYHAGNADTHEVAARLTVGDAVAYRNYWTDARLTTDFEPPPYKWWEYGTDAADYGWYEDPADPGRIANDWKPGVTGYLGLLSNPADDGNPAAYFAGWLRLTWNADTTVTIHDSAFETTPGIPITITAPPAIVPEAKPARFILAAMVSLCCLRRKR